MTERVHAYVVTFHVTSAPTGEIRIPVRAWTADDARTQAKILLKNYGVQSHGIKCITPDEGNANATGARDGC